jgi:ubiquinone/menaquinone biosynthesis C-methylase UbiE
VTLSPEVYERWRRSVVGSITEAREVEIIFDLAGPLEGQRLLDVGCGDGVYLIEAARLGAAATGVDRSEAMLITARRHAADHGVEVELRQGDAHALPFDDGTFDVVVAITMLCLVPDAAKAVNEMARVTVPGGRVIIGSWGDGASGLHGDGSAAGSGPPSGGVPVFGRHANSPICAVRRDFVWSEFVAASTTRRLLPSRE